MRIVYTLYFLLITTCRVKTGTCEYDNPLYNILHATRCHLHPKLHCDFREWKLAKSKLQVLPIDTDLTNHVRHVSNCLFSVVKPIPLKSNVKLVTVSPSVLSDMLDLDVSVSLTEDFVSFVGGGKLLTTPLAHRYGGHQFGSWSGQLGDGRAVMIGEYLNQKGERFELQLKGSGRTPFSRHGDGRAVIRSSVREFLCSEAMFHLGIPTSRAASLLVSDDPVIRDVFYDGHPTTERAAIVLRLAESWFRIGSLEILADSGEYDLLKQLVDFVISNYFTNVKGGDKYLEFFSRVVNDTANLIALWQGVGFTHGVCNTDNFSLLSITIDYGPFGFLEEYNPGFVPNTSDDEGRYSYEKQPDVGYFNLNKLRIAIDPLLTNQQKKQAQIILNGYVDIYKRQYMELLCRKLGLTFDGHNEDDKQLVAILLKMMEETRSDFSMTFRQLGDVRIDQLNDHSIIKNYWALDKLSTHEWYHHWVALYRKRSIREGLSHDTRKTRMLNMNPRYILRNWIAQRVIEKTEANDFSEINKVLRILTKPFEYQTEAETMGFSDPPPLWSKHIKVSCSS